MKRKILRAVCMLTAPCMLLSGCNSNISSETVLDSIPFSTTPTPDSEATGKGTTIIASSDETDIVSEIVTPVETTGYTAEISIGADIYTVSEPAENDKSNTGLKSKTTVWTAPNGETLYIEDAYKITEYSDGSLLYFDKVFYRPSTGSFYNIVDNPDFFDPETKAYLGKKITFDGNDIVSVKTGDRICGYTIKEAESRIKLIDGKAGLAPNWNSITFANDVILTGILTYYNYDEPTLIIEGDIGFTPDSSYEDMPMMRIIPSSGEIKDYSTGIYTDTMFIPLGNYFTDYTDNEDLKLLIGEGEEYITFKAEITISELQLVFADDMGTAWTSGKIKKIKNLSHIRHN